MQEINGMMPDRHFEELMGPRIGGGTSRDVHEVKGRPDLVLKVSKRSPHHANCNEWNVWIEVQSSRWKDIFGQCFAVSTSGEYLIMERLHDLDLNDREKRFVAPSWMRDRKPDARGKTADGTVKIRDYGQVDEIRDLSSREAFEWPTPSQSEGMERIKRMLGDLG